MIRLLFRLVIFALGLCVAAIWFGQMHHLRAAVPDQLPVWSEFVSGTSGIREGAAVIDGLPNIQELDVDWQAKLPDAQGFLWDVRVEGDGVVIDGDLTLPIWPNHVKFDGKGTLDLGKLTGGDVQGIVPIRRATGTLTLNRNTQVVFVDGVIDADVPGGLPREYMGALSALGYQQGAPWKLRFPVPLAMLR